MFIRPMVSASAGFSQIPTTVSPAMKASISHWIPLNEQRSTDGGNPKQPTRDYADPTVFYQSNNNTAVATGLNGRGLSYSLNNTGGLDLEPVISGVVGVYQDQTWSHSFVIKAGASRTVGKRISGIWSDNVPDGPAARQWVVNWNAGGNGMDFKFRTGPLFTNTTTVATGDIGIVTGNNYLVTVSHDATADLLAIRVSPYLGALGTRFTVAATGGINQDGGGSGLWQMDRLANSYVDNIVFYDGYVLTEADETWLNAGNDYRDLFNRQDASFEYATLDLAAAARLTDGWIDGAIIQITGGARMRYLASLAAGGYCGLIHEDPFGTFDYLTDIYVNAAPTSGTDPQTWGWTNNSTGTEGVKWDTDVNGGRSRFRNYASAGLGFNFASAVTDAGGTRTCGATIFHNYATSYDGANNGEKLRIESHCNLGMAFTRHYTYTSVTNFANSSVVPSLQDSGCGRTGDYMFIYFKDGLTYYYDGATTVPTYVANDDWSGNAAGVKPALTLLAYPGTSAVDFEVEHLVASEWVPAQELL
jgi:hypothetical protein